MLRFFILSLLIFDSLFVDSFDVEKPPAGAGLRFVFIHIPKTGGTYLNGAIPKVLGIDSCNVKYKIPLIL